MKTLGYIFIVLMISSIIVLPMVYFWSSITTFFVGLYFLMGFIFLFKELQNTLTPLDYYENTKKWNKKLSKKYKYTDDPRMKKLYEQHLLSVAGKVGFSLSYLTWIFIGLLSSQWILFLSMLVLVVIKGGLMKLSRNMVYKGVVIVIDGMVTIFILGYVILNHFHHFDLICF